MRLPCLLLALVAAVAPVGAETSETLYLELWQPSPENEAAVPDAAPSMLVAVGQPTVSAAIASWCFGLREAPSPRILPEILLRGADYDRFATDSVPLRLEVLIDDVEMRYAMGTERPPGSSGVSFPFFELCAIGFGTREESGWSLDVLHVMNHRGDAIALGVYKGTLPADERAYLATQLDYPVELPDPAGLLLMGDGADVDMLLLVTSPDSASFEALRGRIVR